MGGGWTIKTPSGSLMVSSGVINLTSSTITLPINPNNVQDRSTALSIPMPMPLSLPFVMSYGIESRQLSVQGVIFIAGQTPEYIATNYLVPLRNNTYRVITISGAGARYDGDYILQEFSFTEIQAAIGYFTYNMTLMAYSIPIVM
jgi:hypothetical protein